MKIKSLIALAISACALSFPAAAKVDAAEAAKLGKELTPTGGEKAANKDGTVSAWDGGLTKPPACYKGAGTRYCDPFPEDKPEYTVNKANLDKYKSKLTSGQITLFEKFGDTYKMNVYKTRRTLANPKAIYDATAKNAVNATLGGNGEALTGAITGIPFPIPKTGMEVIWNHKVRYRNLTALRWNNQFAVTTSGDYNQTKLREEIKFSYSKDGITPESLNNVMFYFMQITTAPPRLAGTILLVHETMDQVKEARRAWQYNPGQRRLRRAPNVGYDNPGTGADGLRTNDQTDTYNGAMDRYEWKLVGKKDMLMPSGNSYLLHSDKYKYKDIVKKGHLNQDLPRYEMRRVWVVEANLKKGTSHQYKRRVFFVDEDSWQIRAVDIYDSRDTLWRFQESHTVMAYDELYELAACETVYDLQNNRYLAQALNNEDPESAGKDFDDSYFDPSNVTKLASK